MIFYNKNIYIKLNYTIIILFLIVVSCREKNSNKIIKQPVNKIVTTKIKQHKQNWIELKSLDRSFVFDLRYATTNNFVNKKMYPCPKCYVRPEVAEILIKVQNDLRKKHLGLKFFDCYRPGKIQQELWNIKHDPRYVANPKKGSMHNRGLAVDLTIIDKNGKELDMGTEYDYFGKEAYQTYTKLSDTILNNRKLLRNIMEKYGMSSIKTEWWHYSYRKKKYPIEQWIWDCK